MVLSKSALAVGLCLVVPSTAAVMAQDMAGPPPLELSLREAVEMTLQNNLDIQVAGYTPLVREQDVIFSEAAFDPNVRFFAERQDNRFPTSLRTVAGGALVTSAFDSSEDVISVFFQKQNNYAAAFGDILRYGANYSAQLDMTRQKTSSADSILPIQYQTSLWLSYNQSLIRNFGRDINETPIVIAQNNREVSQSDFRNQVLLVLKQAEDAYWELVFTNEDLLVKKESLRLAEELLKLNKIKVQVGTLPPIEITQAEAEVASRDQGVIVAENAVSNAEDALRQVINMPKTDEAWSRPIKPTDEPQFTDRAVDVPAEIEEALSIRPDLEKVRINMATADTQLAFDRNQLKWDLGFSANYWLRGLSGDDPQVTVIDPNTGIPSSVVVPINEDFLDSFDSLLDLDAFDSWWLSLNLNIPIGNNAAEANYLSSRLEREQQEITYQNTRLKAEVEVRTAARSILTDKKRIEAAEKNVELQRKKVEAEQKKFDNGMSTSFQVLDFQEDLTTALGTKNRALVDYRKSITALEKAKGTLHKYLNVQLN